MTKAFSNDRAYQAFRILQITFFIAPVLAGLDKFFYCLTNWSNYLSVFVLQMINYNDRGFMMGIGVIEIIAGIGVLIKPKLFAYVVFLWLIGIIFNLLLTGQYFDIALRDLGLALAVLSLGRLSHKYST